MTWDNLAPHWKQMFEKTDECVEKLKQIFRDDYKEAEELFKKSSYGLVWRTATVG
jgi:hypothetical protein